MFNPVGDDSDNVDETAIYFLVGVGDIDLLVTLKMEIIWVLL